MPKRSNTFQAVVFMIKNHIAGDAQVTESKELVDLVSGDKREVDVCIEANVAGHELLIGLECRDHKRPQTVGWVEEMHAKHSRLPTDHLVLVSGSGFTASALEKARSFGIETVTPESLTEEQASGIARRLRMRVTRVDMQAETVRAWVDASEHGAAENFLAFPENDVFSESGQLLGSMMDLIQAIMQNASPEANPEFGNVLFDAPEDASHFELAVDLLELKIGDPPVPLPVYVGKRDPVLHLRRLNQIEIYGAATLTRTDFAMQNERLQETTYSWGEATFGDKSAVAVFTEGTDGAGLVSIRFPPATPKP